MNHYIQKSKAKNIDNGAVIPKRAIKKSPRNFSRGFKNLCYPTSPAFIDIMAGKLRYAGQVCGCL